MVIYNHTPENQFFNHKHLTINKIYSLNTKYLIILRVKKTDNPSGILKMKYNKFILF